MSKQVITYGGEEHLVREDTAKAFRGVHWALLSIAAFIIIMLALFFSGIVRLVSDSGTERTPADIEREAR